MALAVHHEVVLAHSARAVWDKLFDADAARGWLGVAAFVLPQRAGAGFCWLYDPGASVPSACVGRVLEVRPHRLLRLRLALTSSGAETEVTLALSEQDGRTTVSLRHGGFPEDGTGPFEHDGWAHGWEHHLELLGDHLDGTPNDYHSGHRAELGVIPVGVVAGRGVLVERVAVGTPADAAGLRAGDLIRGADEDVFDSMEDFDRWIDARVPGEQVRLRVGDRSVPVVLRDKALPEYLVVG
ncbi:MAG: PDZ domain-containing protein [Saccharothrix sp.]|nr:PDZ domain-containing protein [Saccharothrix sp.]